MYKKEYRKNTYKYRKAKQKKIGVSYKKTDYENKVKPFADKMGLPVATVLKIALKEYIERHADPDKLAEWLDAYEKAITVNKVRKA